MCECTGVRGGLGDWGGLGGRWWLFDWVGVKMVVWEVASYCVGE